MSGYLRPTAEIAPHALLPGDPGRALALAQELLAKPLMCNHNRGLWGYTGRTAEGHPLTIQATGVGGPSAAIVLEELATHGVERAIRVGTCRAIAPGLAVGEPIVATSAVADDGASRALDAPALVHPDRALTQALKGRLRRAARSGPVASVDLLYDPGAKRREPGWAAAGALAVELAAAPLMALGLRLGVAVACAVVVAAGVAGAADETEEDGAIAATSAELGRAGARALASSTGPRSVAGRGEGALIGRDEPRAAP